MRDFLHGGFLVAIEGIDGAGKTTAARSVQEHLLSRGFTCLLEKEPTDGPWGQQLRRSAHAGRLSLDEELALFLKDRAQHVEQVIRPALTAGRAVVLDRYYFSNAAYQGARGGVPEEVLEQNERFAPLPDLLLLLDLDPALALQRIRERGDEPNAFEREEALREVRRIFLALRRPHIVVVDAAEPVAVVARHCVAAISAALERKRP